MQQTFSNQRVVTEQPNPHPRHNVSFKNIFMNLASVNLQTHAKGYTSADTSSILEETSVPLRGPLQTLCPSMEKILTIPKSPLRLTPHNPQMKASHNYNIVDDLSQSPTSMSTLEVIQYFPSQRKALLNALGTIDSFDSHLINFDLNKGELQLPSFLAFQVPLTLKKL